MPTCSRPPHGCPTHTGPRTTCAVLGLGCRACCSTCWGSGGAGGGAGGGEHPSTAAGSQPAFACADPPLARLPLPPAAGPQLFLLLRPREQQWQRACGSGRVWKRGNGDEVNERVNGRDGVAPVQRAGTAGTAGWVDAGVGQGGQHGRESCRVHWVHGDGRGFGGACSTAAGWCRQQRHSRRPGSTATAPTLQLDKVTFYHSFLSRASVPLPPAALVRIQRVLLFHGERGKVPRQGSSGDISGRAHARMPT